MAFTRGGRCCLGNAPAVFRTFSSQRRIGSHAMRCVWKMHTRPPCRDHTLNGSDLRHMVGLARRHFSSKRRVISVPEYSLLTEHVVENLRERLQGYDELTVQRDRLAADLEAKPSELTKINVHLSSQAGLSEAIRDMTSVFSDIEELIAMSDDPDCGEEMAELIMDDYASLVTRFQETEQRVIEHLVQEAPVDKGNAILEIRAGAGGREAALFALELFKMYERYCKRNNWKIESVEADGNPDGGLRHLTASVSGHYVFGTLQHETGVHRVQRIPDTESQGRVHTSTSVVVVLPEPTKSDLPEISEKDMKIETFKASGAGGQHVNTTDSAVRLTHVPTGVIVECQSERSQLQNKQSAMKILRARIFDLIREREREEQKAERMKRTGKVTGERGERIRTYNIPQDRVTDHRCGFDTTASGVFKDNALSDVIDALKPWHSTNLLEDVIAQMEKQ